MCVICLDYKRGAITRQEAMMNLAEMIAVASEENDDLFTHLEEVEQSLLDEESLNDNRETD
jgi:uncharacterized protein YigA (DUF484 family)